MNKNSKDFIIQLTKLSNLLEDEMQNTVKYWEPEEPPITVLFGDIGREITKQFYNFECETKNKIFALIEQGINSDDDELGTAVATGTIEAMVGSAYNDKKLWEAIKSSFGEASRDHAVAWSGE